MTAIALLSMLFYTMNNQASFEKWFDANKGTIIILFFIVTMFDFVMYYNFVKLLVG